MEDVVAVSEDEYLEADDENTGWCVYCKEFTGQFAEPGAVRYKCDACGHKTLFGAAEALLCGFITFGED
jgi:hypothetical protein